MVEPQPNKIPTWNTGGLNRTEPTVGDKVTGWTLNDQPPSAYFNWLQYYAGAWLGWLEERVHKGSLENDLIVEGLQPDTSGKGGDLTLRAGQANATGAGGDLTVRAGHADTSGVGGDVGLQSGDGVGTNRNSGSVVVESGVSTGTGRGRIDFEVSEAETGGSGSGSYANSKSRFMRMDGTSGQPTIYADRYLQMQNAGGVDPARGVTRIIGKAQPTSPALGDIYLDANTEQMAVKRTAGYKNLDTIVYNISDDAVLGQTPGATAATTYVINEVPYGGGVGTAPLRHVIPANTLRIGTIIRVRAQFTLEDLGGISTFPSPRVYVGSIGVGPSPYTAPTGVQIFHPARASLIWDRCYVECELSIRGLGLAGAADLRWRSMFDETSSSVRPIDIQSIVNTVTVDTTASLDVFAAALFGTSIEWQVELFQFMVDVI